MRNVITETHNFYSVLVDNCHIIGIKVSKSGMMGTFSAYMSEVEVCADSKDVGISTFWFFVTFRIDPDCDFAAVVDCEVVGYTLEAKWLYSSFVKGFH